MKKNIPTNNTENNLTLTQTLVPGLYYCQNFLQNSQATQILQQLHNNDHWIGVTTNPKARRVIHYGHTYSYLGNGLTKTVPIPEVYHNIIQQFDQLIQQINIDANNKIPSLGEFTQNNRIFDQLIINEYLPGQGIAPHTDHIYQFGPIIVCITLSSGTVIHFTHKDYQPIDIYVEPNSLYIMSNEARYNWKHSISQRKTDIINKQKQSRQTRISLTFRQAN